MENIIVTDEEFAFVPKAKYDEMVADRDLFRSYYNTANTNHQSLHSTVEEWIKENYNTSYVSQDDLKELAENCGIALTRSISFTVNVTFNCTAEVDMSVDLDNLADELSFNASLDTDYIDGMTDFTAEDDGDIIVENVEEN